MNATKPLALTGTAALALALLTGCSTAEPEDGTADTNATAETTAPVESSPAASADESATDGGSAAGEDTAATGEDPVFAAIDALLAEHSDAVIVEIDREDDDSQYDIEAVIGGELRDFDVMEDGTVREDTDDDDDDDDDIRKAGEATMTAAEAAQAALEGRDGTTVDDVELEEENGALRWEVSLDNESGDDDDDYYVDDATGEVTEDD